MIQIWERDGERREEGRRKEGKEEERLKKKSIFFGFVFFSLFIGFGGLCCFILLEGLIKGSHHVLIIRYIF